jgi:endogenous inhibitor of DNA gyrase (YacG/DUF329 family)
MGDERSKGTHRTAIATQGGARNFDGIAMGLDRRYACPICGRDAQPRAKNGFFPFCTEACKWVDLGKWLDGTYRIPGPPVEAHAEGAEERRDDRVDEEDE